MLIRIGRIGGGGKLGHEDKASSGEVATPLSLWSLRYYLIIKGLYKWMRWTTRGLEAILNIMLVRYTSEETYENFKEKMMRTDNLRFIKGDVKIISAGGEL